MAERSILVALQRRLKSQELHFKKNLQFQIKTMGEFPQNAI